MYQQSIHVQGLKQGEIKQAILDVASNAQFEGLFAAVAYSTIAGSVALVEGLRSVMQNWSKVKKEWLISVDYGLTEPDALEYLQKLPKSQVRVHDGIDVINRKLQPIRSFHPKVYFFLGEAPGILGLVSGSANLTLSGLHFNNEQAISSIWKNPVSARDELHRKQALEALEELRVLFDSSDIVNASFIKKYSKVWKKRGAANEDYRPKIKRLLPKVAAVGIGKSSAYSVARSFWVDLGYVNENRGPGIPGNQIDLQRGSRVFFEFSAKDVVPNTSLGSISIIFGGHTVPCNMGYGKNQMDKLNLPIPGNPGPPTYENTTLMFTRKGKLKYELHVGTSAQKQAWRSLSRSQGTFYKMASGREFGVIR